MQSATQTRRLAAILAVDMAGYSGRADADEAAAVAAVHALAERVREAARAHSGRVFNSAGDGFMLEFPSPNEALAAAADLLEKAPAGAPPVRVGVHVGDVFVAESGDLLGHGVNVAARLQSEAGENCALVSKAVQSHINGPLAERLTPIGRIGLKGLDAPLAAFAYDPQARPFWRKRRLRTQIWVGAAGGALVAGLIALAASAALQPSREDLLREISADVTRRLVAEASQDSVDGAHQAILRLSQSGAAAEQQAFSFLREGETENAVAALEAYAAELVAAGQAEEASRALGRAGALAFAVDKTRALANLRAARTLAPLSLERFAELLQATQNAEGYQRAFALADEAEHNAPTPAIRVYALLYGSLMAGDVGEHALQRRKIEAATPLTAQANDRYLDALAKIARGYLALSELDLAAARRLYMQGRAELSRIPGHERDHQHGWLLALLAMGDLETALSAGRAFVAEREAAGAPPSPQLMLNTCVAAIQLRQTARAAPYCRAGAAALEGSTGAATGGIALAMLAAEEGDLIAARAHLEAARASPTFAAIPANFVYAGRAEAQIAAKSGDAGAMHRAVDNVIARVGANAPMASRAAIFIPWLEMGRGQWAIELGETEAGCAALARAAEGYRRIGAEPGAAHAARLRGGARCASA